MRITGGNAARRILKVPKGLDVRPTPDLVKQAVFNSLGERVVGARVLELFAGSGALSLECLSRGAAGVLCIEKSHRHAEFIRSNAAAASLALSAPVLTVSIWELVAIAFTCCCSPPLRNRPGFYPPEPATRPSRDLAKKPAG